MKKKLLILLSLLSIVITGCWDRKELNDLAILLGWGMDLSEDGTYFGSAQFILPSKLSSDGKSGPEKAYFIETAKGKNLMDVSRRIQNKLSRTVFGGHRRSIFIGEKLARHGISKLIDEYSRNPDVRLRSDIFVVKGETANHFLNVSYPFEKVPAIAAHKIRLEAVSATTTLADFLMAASGDEESPTVPTVEIVRNKDSSAIRLGGRAIFDEKLNLIGYLSYKEAVERLWLLNRLKKHTIIAHIPEGEGNISYDGDYFKSTIKPVITGDKISFEIFLEGTGKILENNTNLDLKELNNLKVLEKTLEETVQKDMLNMIKKVQKNYGTDVFGFRKAIHKKHPYAWKKMKETWNEKFRKAELSIRVDLKIKNTGLTGLPLHQKGGAIK
ncbi:Ger(x)C family spore germination protein [Paenibacillus naphthalenovorans]|uniref:Ger(x)C family spore germination protein n=1 Tax=Paenibacillus naphthalenovorans TaxID=162209 RepID=UPI003D2652BF